MEENARRPGAGGNFWLRRDDQPRTSAKCRANILSKVGMNIRPNGWENRFVNFGMSVAAYFGTSGGANFRTVNFRTKRNGRERITAKNIRRNFGRRYFGTENGLRRKTNRGTVRQNRRGERGSFDGKMKRFRLFRFQSLQFFLLAKLARDFAERTSRSRRICVEACRGILCGSRRTIFFRRIFLGAFALLGFDLRAVFRSQNVRVFEIFLGVNMLGASL